MTKSLNLNKGWLFDEAWCTDMFEGCEVLMHQDIGSHSVTLFTFNWSLEMGKYGVIPWIMGLFTIFLDKCLVWGYTLSLKIIMIRESLLTAKLSFSYFNLLALSVYSNSLNYFQFLVVILISCCNPSESPMASKDNADIFF